MSSLRHRLRRRTLLSASGIALALPWFPSLMRSRRAEAAPSGPSVRLVYWHIPNGVIEEHWTPPELGTMSPATLPRSLQPLAEEGVVEDVNIISELDNLATNPDGFGDHAVGVCGFLTCSSADRSRVFLGTSADQIAAQALGDLTVVPSLELGMTGNSGFCDQYPCPYSNSMSWSDPQTPRVARRDPREVWALLTGGFTPDSVSEEERARRERAGQSVLDFVLDQANEVQGRLGAQDKVKLDQYMSSVRALERRIVGLPSNTCELPAEPGGDLDYAERFALMLDLQLFALQCDLTRIVTFMFATSFGPGGMPWAGVPDDYHNLTHDERGGDNYEKILRCIDWEMQQIAAFIARLKAVPEENGSLLDNMALCISSDVGRGARHNHDRLPVLLAGRGAGAWQTGRHLRFDPEDGGEARRLAARRTQRDRAEGVSRPNTNRVANLHVTLLAAMGVPNAKVGDSNGALPLD